MTRAIAAVTAMMLAATAAWADDVTAGGLPYADVKIIDVKDGELVFHTVPGNREITKPLAEVDSVKIADQAEFNQAEELLRAGKAAEAARQYEAARSKAAAPWLATLIRYRLLAALDKAGQIDKASEEWLALVEAGSASAKSLALRPGNVPKAGTKDNARAIDLLEARLKTIGESNPAYARAVRELLLKLYQQEGRPQATALAEQLSKPVAPQSQDGEKTSPSASKQGSLDAAAFLIEQGKADQVVSDIQSALRTYGEADLPKALLVLGKAQMRLAEKAEPAKARTLLLAGGLNFMRVAVLFPGAPEAPEALYLAGKVNAQLGNQAAAAQVFQHLISQHGTSEFARKAQAELGAAEKK